MRARRRIVERLGDPVRDLLAQVVLQFAGQVVDVLPGQLEEIDQHPLDKPVLSQQRYGELLAFGRETNALIRGMLYETELREALEHGSDRGRRYRHIPGNIAGADDFHLFLESENAFGILF